MFKRGELKQLIVAMRTSGVTTLEVKRQRQSLRLVLNPGPSSHPLSVEASLLAAGDPGADEAPETKFDTATSPTIGTFLSRGLDDGLRPVEVGMNVLAGEVLGYICHGALRTVVTAPVTGMLSDQETQDGDALGMGDIVFKLKVTT